MRDKYIGAAIATAAMLATAGCSDDTFDNRADAGSEIRFSVSTSGYRQIGSRSAGNGAAQRSLELTDEAGHRLYLVPQVVTRAAAESRSSSVTSADMADFGVYAVMTGGDPDAYYMQNIRVTRANNWTPEKAYLWPGAGSLTFTAYSPYSATPPESSAGGELTISYTTPAEVADQTDLLRADPVEASASPCALTFSHALVAVGFATGDEMAPCTVDSIRLSGIVSSGTLAISTGKWSSLSGSASYGVAPGVTLPAASGSAYAAPGTAITADDERFLLIPQSVADGAEVALTVTTDGNKSTFRASLAGQTWEAGQLVIYRLSASPASSQLELQMVDADGNPVDSIATPYTGGSRSYTVLSRYTDPSGAISPVKWTATLLDTDGNPTTTLPDWIEKFTTEGSDSTDASLTTALPDPVFLEMSDHTRIMRHASDINTTSGHTPYNLSSTTGAATVETTANCYLINAPGVYSLPLVYGNAVKEGTANPGAYTSTITHTTAHNRQVLYQFINHLGNEITDPYIYNNSGCTPDHAKLVWEDHLNIVRDVKLSSDGHNIEFNIPASSFRQGNALVAVCDADGNIMWSWQLWLTDHTMEGSWQEIVSDVETEYISANNLGRIYAGDRTEFQAKKATVRLTQTDVPDGLTPLTLDITLTQQGKIIYTEDCYTIYQWGRKDAIISQHDSYYDADHNEYSSATLPTMTIPSTHKEMIVSSILHPATFFVGDDSSLRGLSPYYVNLWSIDELPSSGHIQPQNVKTIYDPSPAGSKLAVGNAFQTLTTLTGTYDEATMTVTVTAPGGEEITFPLLGHRNGASSVEMAMGTHGQTWTSVARNGASVRYVDVGSDGKIQLLLNSATQAMSVRPAKE